MKFKFVKEVQDIINTLANYPAERAFNGNFIPPWDVIDKFYVQVSDEGRKTKYTTKEWSKVRRQASFLFEFIRLTHVAEYERINGKGSWNKPNSKKSDTPFDLDNKWRMLVQYMKDIKNEKMLSDPEMLSLALEYGVVFLSKFEIQTLIQLRTTKK